MTETPKSEPNLQSDHLHRGSSKDVPFTPVADLADLCATRIVELEAALAKAAAENWQLLNACTYARDRMDMTPTNEVIRDQLSNVIKAAELEKQP